MIKALDYLHEYSRIILSNSSCSNVLIVSDSLSVLQAISTPPYNRNISAFVIKIRVILQELQHERNTRIAFVWVPAHQGIPGNKVADGAAKQTCISQYTYKFEAISENLSWQLAQATVAIQQDPVRNTKVFLFGPKRP